MKKFVLTFLLIAVCGVCGAVALWRSPVSAYAEGQSGWASADGTAVPQSGGVLDFGTGVYYYDNPIDLESGGFTVSMSVKGDFRREDSWFAFLLQSEHSDAIGKYKGVNIQFKPVSTQGVNSGEMPAYISTYNVGTAEGGGMASNLATVKCASIAERETPYRFNFSLFVSDGTFVVAYGLDSYTYKWSIPGADLSKLKLSLIFGGADAGKTKMHVAVNSAGEAKSGGFFTHACEVTEEDGGTRIAESAKRQGKVFYPVALSDSKEISVKFKINTSPEWYVNDGSDASWFGIMLSSSPNVCLPGSATVATIIRAHELTASGIGHVGGQFFYNGSYVSGYPVGTNLKSGEYSEFIYSFGQESITMTLIGENERTQTIAVDGSAFLGGKVYLSFAFNDAAYASIIEKNEFGEEVGRTPDPDVKYWDVTIGDISEYGTPTVEADGKRINVRGGAKAQIPVRLYGGKVSALYMSGENGYDKVSASKYAVRYDGENATLLFTDSFMSELGLGEKNFRLVTSHTRADYDGAETDFSVEFADADIAAAKVSAGRYDGANPTDVKYSFTLNDDSFISLEGYGIDKSGYFYNPVTGNLYIRREYLKNLSDGEYKFTANFEFTKLDISLDYATASDSSPATDGNKESGCKSSAADSTFQLAAILLAASAVILARRRKA